MIGVEVRALSKYFGDGSKSKAVLSQISFVVEPGEVVAIRGDNGSGKTTLLNLIAGIELPTSGELEYIGDIGRKPRIGYTQQDYSASLLPWMNALDNISVPLRLQGINKRKRRELAQELMNQLGFSTLPILNFPHQLSGGQKQKVAIARALICDPELLILDEPFANLDAHTIMDLQKVLSEIHERKRITLLYVSHELDHCVFLADRVFLLHGIPATVVADIQIPIERPRRRFLLLTESYEKARSEILLKEEQLYASTR
jgi:NitT/TauT family transport system ATP-binding protein